MRFINNNPLYRLWAIQTSFLIASCSSNDDLPTKDVTFEVPITCAHLTLTDYYGNDILNSVTLHDIDSVAYIDFNSMPYGNHTLELTTGDNTSSASFVVSDATSRTYTINLTTSLNFHINPEWSPDTLHYYW